MLEEDLNLSIAPIDLGIDDEEVLSNNNESQDEYSDLCTEIIMESVKDVGGQQIYPSIRITGVTTEAELDFFSSLKREGIGTLPLYIQFDDCVRRFGELPLSLDVMLLLRSIAPYEIWLCKDKETEVFINLSEPTDLIKFININS